MNMKLLVEIDFNVQPKKCSKRSFDDDDRISRLPDDILIHILSFLSLKESGRTSVLSSRWINLWKYIPSLDFDAQSVLENIAKSSGVRRKLMKSEAPKYVKWVNSVLQLHKSPTLKEFIIRFTLDITAKHSISLWLQFAFARQVERLELDLLNYCISSLDYYFPEEILPLNNKLQTPSDIFWIHRPLMPDNFKSLKDLSFKSVHLSGGVIEFFLHNCPLLERLVVHRSYKISNLEVCGPSLRLKHLEIVYCRGLKTLKVSLPNLTSLRVNLVEVLLLEYVPMLDEVYVSCNDYDMSPKRLIYALSSSCISQLETLCLELYTTKETNEIYKYPEMPKLKKLFIMFNGDGGENLFKMTAFIRASPSLEEFELKYDWWLLMGKDREIKDAVINIPHHHLKNFKFSGYYGWRSHDALLGYILENCIALEKIIIDPSCSCGRDRLTVEQTARKNAKEHLKPRVPLHVELVIL